MSASIFHRRAFLAGSAAAAVLHGQPAFARPKKSRIAFSTTSLRDRLPFRLPGAPAPKPGSLTMLGAPDYAATQVGLRQMEVWNLQFEDTSLDYCRQLRIAADRAKVSIINLQVDARMVLDSPDPAERARSLVDAKEWVDRARLIGSPSMRVNFSAMSPKYPFAVGPAAESLRALADYGRKRGVLILVENHIGHSIPVNDLAAVLKEVSHPNLRTVFDWGNVIEPTTERIIAGLGVLAPWLHLVSAKGVVFDQTYRMTSYDVAEITRATERLGYRGLYSIELFGPTPQGFDPLAGIRSMERTITPNLLR